MPEVVDEVARRLASQSSVGILRVAVDGVDGVGKSTFADKLAEALRALNHTTIRASVDGFHNPRDYRYRRGRSSPEGFYLDSYDYEKLRSLLLEPLSPGGSRIYRSVAFDHQADQLVEVAPETAPDPAILIVDGIFLQREELRDFWDVSIFLEAPFEITVPRGAARGPGFGSPDLQAPSNRRYVEGQKLYLREARPKDRATLVVDYSDLCSPMLVR